MPAALDVNPQNKGALNDVVSAKILLIGAYQATILAAATHGIHKVFLTLLGTGAFGNKLEWINEALETPFDINGKKTHLTEIINHAGMEVNVVVHADPRPGREKKQKNCKIFCND